ncbi:hypothetical protein GCM10023216_02370 [Isoptericola chiayiensis]|uniref:ABC-2 type transport system permease protein n=1 Tax=Isoptericola chiayiensis TaxID=579446 RepID=A0ABP8XY99_9MICO|nr:hypothetical protein [Isoptericola chiayiensis]NOW01056.1 hypothetical protein [Isoptericola chiayiensis]
MSGDGDAADTAGLAMPYGPWRRWVRALRAHHRRRRADDDGDRTYLAYGFTLLALMYGPILWTTLAQAGVPLGEGAGWSVRGTLVVAGTVVVAAAGLGGVVLARLGAPLWVTRTDAAYVLSGVWDPRAVLWRRVLVLVAVAGVLAALVGSALAFGALDAAGTPAGAGTLTAWGACAAGVAMLPLTLAVAAQCPRWRTTARVAAALIAAVGVLVAVQGADFPVGTAVLGADVLCVDPSGCAPLPVRDGVAPAGPPAAVVGWAAGLAVVCGWLLLAVLPRDLDADVTAEAWSRTVATGEALGAGDATGVRAVAGPARLTGRRRTFPRILLPSVPLVARDVLALSRRPAVLLGSLPAGVAGAALLALAAGGGPGAAPAAVGGGVVLYAAAAAWTGGLRDLAEQAEPGGLLPGGPSRAVRGHLPVPVALGAVSGALGLLVAAVLAGVDGSSVVLVGTGLVVALGARVWVAGATQAPPEVFTPVAGPTGDLSTVMVIAWFLRAWLVVIGSAWVVARLGLTWVPLVVVVVVALAAAGARRLDRG